MLGEPELDRGRTQVSPAAGGPCPPLPFIAAGTPPEANAEDARPPSRRTAPAMVVAGLAIVVLGTLVVTGERGANSGTTPAETLPGSAEVARVTAPNAPADRVHPGSTTSDSQVAGHGHGGPTSSGEDGGKGHSGSGSGDPSAGGGDDGGSSGGGGGDESKPLATADLPVVGTVTVDEPKLPPVPDVDAPDVPGVAVPEVQDVELP